MRLPNNTPKQFSWYESKGLDNPQLEDGNTPDGTNQGRIYTADLTKDDKYSVNYIAPIVSAVSSRTTKGNDYSSIITVSYTADLASSYATVPGFFGSNLISVNDSFTIEAQDKDYVRGIVTKVLDKTGTTITTGGSAGSIDPSFITGSAFRNGGSSGYIFDVQIQSDNKLIYAGGYTSYNGTSANRIARVNPDGSVDTSFVSGNGFDDRTKTIAIQSDGKILVGGQFYSYDGAFANRIIRLNSDGSVDGSFMSGNGFDSTVEEISVQLDGKILVGGQFQNYDGNPARRIIRLNSDGSIDGSFMSGGFLAGNFATIESIAIQPDNKILVGGAFTDYNGTPIYGITRLNTDGSIDTSFITGTGITGTVMKILIQPDGKILVGGSFQDYNGTFAQSIIRLNVDGSIDTTFNSGTGPNYWLVPAIDIQTDGKILIGGWFQSYNGTPAQSIIRLNADGSPDTTFVAAVGNWGYVYNILVQPDGMIVISGSITDYNGVTFSGTVRVFPGTTPVNMYTYVLQCSIIQGNPMTIAPKDHFLWKRSLVMDEANFNEANPPINLVGSLNYNTRELYFYWDNVNKESREYRIMFRYSLATVNPFYTVFKVHGNTSNPVTALTAFVGQNSAVSCIRIDDPGIDMNSDRTIDIKGNGIGALYATELDTNGSLLINEFYVYDAIIGTNKICIVAEKMRSEDPSQYPFPNNNSYAEGLPAIAGTNDYYMYNIVQTDYNLYEVEIFDATTDLPISITPTWESEVIGTYIKSHDGVYSINLGIGYDSNIKAEVKRIPDNVQAYIDPLIPGTIVPAVGTTWAWSVAAIYDDINKQYTEWSPEDYIHF